VDDLVKRLRKKLKAADSNLAIQTVWGYGYKFEAKA
jgi:DNA-binding response OmpR family regulator